MAGDRLLVGCTLPIRVTVEKAAGDLDFVGTNVSAATFEVDRPDGTAVSMACTLSGATATEVTLTHACVPTDLTIPGIYRARAKMTVPGNTLWSDRFPVRVEEE